MFACPAIKPVRTVMLALVLSACVATAHAQQPSAAAIATAKELITVKGAAALYNPLIPGVVEQAKGVFLQTNPMLAKPLNDVAAKLRAEYAARNAEVLNDMATLYASHFSAQELKDALNFYKSPLGRKMIAEEPKVLDQAMKNAQVWADRLSQEIISRMRAEMKKLGHDI